MEGMDSEPLYLEIHKELNRIGGKLTVSEFEKIIETAFFSFATQRTHLHYLSR